VQVFGCRRDESMGALMRPATEKRQGTKSRWVMQRRCRGRLWGFSRGDGVIHSGLKRLERSLCW
jgi:hypothetical protein